MKLINFHKYLETQKTEDRRTFIVHGQAMSGKSRFAQRIESAREDVFVLDLLSDFAENEKALCSPSTFWEFLLETEFSTPVVIIDNADFLINSWNSEERESFLNKINRQIRSPSDTLHTFGFFLQTDDMFRNVQIKNSHGESRVLSLDDLEAL